MTDKAIWIVTDGKIGDRVQCFGVANALDGSIREIEVPGRRLYDWLAPFGPLHPADAPNGPGSVIAPPFPAIAILSGRRAIAFGRAIKRASGGEVFTIILKDPRVPARFADLIWAPSHDRRNDPTLFKTLTSPHGHGAALHNPGAAPAALAGLKKPWLGVLLGGPSGGARYDVDDARRLGAALLKASRDYGGLAVTPSRRTPSSFTDALRASLGHGQAYIWDGEGENPYVGLLAHAQTIIVAGDSHNMVSEACAARAGVYIWRPAGLSGKLDRFAEALAARRRIRFFDGDAAPFSATPIDATDEIVKEAMRRMAAKR